MRYVVILLAPFIFSCSLILPYEEKPLCEKKEELGYCGSLTEIYRDMEENPWKYGLEER